MVNSTKRTLPSRRVEPSAKRSRVSRACDQCRASREKCDGALPRCQTCTLQERICSYNKQPKKRGLQPNYIRTLELTLAWLFRNFPEAESRLVRGLPQENDHARLVIGGEDKVASEEVHNTWRSSLVNRQIEQMLSGDIVESHDVTTQGTNEYDSHSASADYVPPPVSTRASMGDITETTHSTGRTTPSQSNIDYQAWQQDTIKPLEPTERLIKLPENVWTLIEHYFAFTATWLPMTEKHNILKFIYSYPPQGVPREILRAAEHAELWSILNLAVTQVLGESNVPECQRLRDIAESLIPVGNNSYEIPHIRAMILLALDDLQKGRTLPAWLGIGTVVRLLTLFRLLENLGNTEKWCRHIHLAAFIVESAISSMLNTRGHLCGEYVEAIGVVEEDGLEEWAPWADPIQAGNLDGGVKLPARSFSTMNELLRISMTISRRFSNRGIPVKTSLNNNDPAVVLLLKNAALRGGRIQPSSLVSDLKTSFKSATDLKGTSYETEESIESSLLLADSTGSSSHPVALEDDKNDREL